MLNQLNLSDIRSFVLIAQLGNFTKAAEALGVSRSHVSRQITALEKQLGVSLLIRTTRSLKLTYAGERFFDQCESAIKQMEQAVIAAVDDTEEVRGLIRINSVGGHIGEEVIAELAADFMRLYPEVRVDLDFSSNRIDLIEDQFDIAFRMGRLEDANFVGKYLQDIEMKTLASPYYIKHHGAPAHPRELQQHRILRGSVTRWSYQLIADPEQKFDVQIKGHLISKNGRALVMGALKGNGLIRVPSMYCSQEIAEKRLVSVMPEWEIPSVPFYAIYHRDRYQPKRLRTFLEYVQANWPKELFQ